MPFKNSRGQVAIFVVLIFQVLFILFAMTINIALVVHDKINFQNSLDLAAYYGAKQQAEVLNAMAHINYQMRQNWKLLAWRYRILGTLAQEHGYYKGIANKPYWCPQNESINQNRPDEDKSVKCDSPPSDFLCESKDIYPNNYCDRYFVCIANDLWKRGIKAASQNFCERFGTYIEPIRNTGFGDGDFAFTESATQAIDELIQQVSESCPAEAAVNWLMTQFFLSHFRFDQRDRRIMMEKIFNETLAKGKDLDGKRIFDGAKKVFYHNLTKSNKQNIDSSGKPDYGLKKFNSFHEDYGDFNSIFEPIKVWPVLMYLNNKGTGQGDCNVEPHAHYNEINGQEPFVVFAKYLRNTNPKHDLADNFDDNLSKLFNNNISTDSCQDSDHKMRCPVIGFVKNPNKILYYGLSINGIEYKSDNQLFSLINREIEFRGSAFAKPFGGRFSPQEEEMDPLIPTYSIGTATNPEIPGDEYPPGLLQPNYSRWPGDEWGLIDRRLHDNNQSLNFLNKHPGFPKEPVYTMEAFFHLIFGGGPDDPLARPPLYGNEMEQSFMRLMELMAVYPDFYDLSYYSISANYHDTYFRKICKLLIGKECNDSEDPKKRYPFSNSSNFPSFIRGDFGWPETEKYIKKTKTREPKIRISVAPYFLTKDNNLKEGLNNTKNVKVFDDPRSSQPLTEVVGKVTQGNYPLTQGKFFYPWLARLPQHLLSSWSPNNITTGVLKYENYKIGESFMNCHKPPPDNDKAQTPSACVRGGRSGYSVKLISCEVVDKLQPKSDIDCQF